MAGIRSRFSSWSRRRRARWTARSGSSACRAHVRSRRAASRRDPGSAPHRCRRRPGTAGRDRAGDVLRRSARPRTLVSCRSSRRGSSFAIRSSGPRSTRPRLRPNGEEHTQRWPLRSLRVRFLGGLGIARAPSLRRMRILRTRWRPWPWMPRPAGSRRGGGRVAARGRAHVRCQPAGAAFLAASEASWEAGAGDPARQAADAALATCADPLLHADIVRAQARMASQSGGVAEEISLMLRGEATAVASMDSNSCGVPAGRLGHGVLAGVGHRVERGARTRRA